jgi:LysM repeat protein
VAHIRSAPKVLAALFLAAAVALSVLVVSPRPAGADTYVVQPGDTLSLIARKHGVSTGDLAAANAITNHHLIRVGQALTVPSLTQTYTVVSGDTVSGIAKRFGVASRDILALNALPDPHRIRVGQKLQIPTGTGGGPAGPTVSSTERYRALPNRIRSNPDRLALVPVFERWANHYGVPADLLMAICYQESGWQSSVVSNKDAVGIGQLLPGTAAWLANDLIQIPGLDVYNPDDNIRMSARFLRWLIRYHGSESLAIAGYYQGPTSVGLRGPYPQTQVYVAAVEGGRWRFQPS